MTHRENCYKANHTLLVKKAGNSCTHGRKVREDVILCVVLYVLERVWKS